MCACGLFVPVMIPANVYNTSVMDANKATYLSIGFVAVTMIANVMSLRMIAPLGIVMDAGALLYPVTFILRDMLHRSSGLNAANRAVTASVICNVAMFALFAVAAWLPADPETGAQLEFGRVLMPGALIVLGSVVAQFVSERLDGRIYQSIWRDGEGSHTKAMLISNLISIPVDSVLMCGIAFGLTVPLASVALTTLSNIGIKYIVMVVVVLCAWSGERAHKTASSASDTNDTTSTDDASNPQ